MPINLERAGLESRLRGAEEDLRRLEVKADGLVAQIRFKIDPYADSVTELDTDDARIAMEELCKVKAEAVELKRRIKEYKGALYG